MDFEALLQQGVSKVSGEILNLGGRILISALTLLLGLWLIKWVAKLIKKTLKKLNVEEGTAGFLTSIIRVGLYVVLGFMIASTFGIDAASIVAILGSAGVAIGLAIQGSLSNFAGGILIILLQPFKVGDYIIEDNKGNEGTVTQISIIYTHLQTLDGRTVVLPNGTLANTSLTNVTKTPTRLLELKVGVAYESDWKRALTILDNIIKNDPDCISKDDVETYVSELGDSAIILGGRCNVRNGSYRFAKQRMQEQILTCFEEEKIEISYQKVVVYHNENK